MEYLQKVLEAVGLEPERLLMDYCTAAEGQKFQIDATAFDKTIRELGPSPLKTQRGAKKKAKA